MLIVAFNGSPRKGGNTETLLKSVALGVEQAGGTMDIVRLSELNISPCIGCGGCTKTGKCVVIDDMQPLYDKVLAAQRIIIASPIYFYALSAQTKMFIDRLQALWSRKQLMKAKHTWHPDPDRKGYLLAVAATRGPRLFEGPKLCAQYAYDAIGFTYAGDFLVRGVDRAGEIKKYPEKLKEAEEFGRNIVTS